MVNGLNRAGFSDEDYRSIDHAAKEIAPEDNFMVGPDIFATSTPKPVEHDKVDTTTITFRGDEPATAQPTTNEDVLSILQTGAQEAAALQAKIEQQEQSGQPNIPNEILKDVKTSTIKSAFLQSAESVKLPQFYSRLTSQIDIFQEQKVLLRKEHLLRDFKLAEQDIIINFDAAATSFYRIDLDPETDNHTPRYFKIDNAKQREYITNYLRDSQTPEEKVRKYAALVSRVMGKMSPLGEKDVRAYVERILQNMSSDEFEEFISHMNDYTAVIKKKIETLETAYMKTRFEELVDAGKIITQPAYSLPKTITLQQKGSAISKSLYNNEDGFNDFEAQVINDVAALPNVEWWTRNVEKKGFCINGFINHYPDFIIKMKSGVIVVLETKGDHLDAENKIRLGQLWANCSGFQQYKYCLVYEERLVDGAYTRAKFLETIKEL